MNIHEETRRDVTIVRIHERLIDAGNAPALREVLMRNVEAGNTRLVVDLSAAEYMDSSALGALVSTFQRSGSRGAMAIVGVGGAVARLVALTGMDRILTLHGTTEDAVACMAA